MYLWIVMNFYWIFQIIVRILYIISLHFRYILHLKHNSLTENSINNKNTKKIQVLIMSIDI